MPETEPELYNFELVYLNGQDHGAPPKFRDVFIEKKGQKTYDLLLEEAKRLDKPLHSDSELQKCLDLCKHLQTVVNQLQLLERTEREPFQRILAQISTAINPLVNIATSAMANIKARMAAWRALKLEGERAEAARLKAKAEQKSLEAQYADNPQKRRAAKVEAKQLERAAKAATPKPEPGVDTVEYYEFEIEDRHLAAKLYPEEAVHMTPDEDWFRKKAAEKKRNGEALIFPGINVIRKTRVRVHR